MTEQLEAESRALISEREKYSALHRSYEKCDAEVRRLRALLEKVIEAARAACNTRPCPCCDGEWECLPECTFAEDDPGGAEEMQADREQLRPLREALGRLDAT